MVSSVLWNVRLRMECGFVVVRWVKGWRDAPISWHVEEDGVAQETRVADRGVRGTKGKHGSLAEGNDKIHITFSYYL